MARLAAGIRKRKDGTLEKRFTINGKRYSAYGKTNKEVNEKEHEIREKLKQGIYTDNRNITFDGYFKEWIERKKSQVKESTVYSYSCYYNHLISPELGSRKLQQLERRELFLFREKLAGQHSPTHVNQTFKVLRMILNDAVTDDILLKNPALGMKALKNTETPAVKTKHRALTEHEQKIFMEAARSNYCYELMAILLLTGMRQGEAAALTWNDIDYKSNVIHITKTRTITNKGNAKIGDSPKTDSSIRDIPMNDTIRKILKLQKEKMALINGTVIIPFNQRIFSTQRDGLINYQTLGRAIDSVLDQLEKEGTHIERFTAHCFRDTFATRFIEQGGNPQTLKKILGHSSLAMTMDLYSHVLPNTKQKEMDLMQISV